MVSFKSAIRQGTKWWRRFQETLLQPTEHQGQRKEEQTGGISIFRCSDGCVANCDSQMDCLEIKFWNWLPAIACKLPSEWPTDLSDHQSASKHMLLVSNH